MHHKTKILDPKSSNKNNLKQNNFPRAISLLLNTSNLSSNNNVSKRIQPNMVKKSNSVDKITKKKIKSNKNNNKKPSHNYNLSLQRQNSQGALYSLKNYINDTQLNNNNNIKYQRLKPHLLSETKTPKLMEILNNKIKRKRYYLESYNHNNNLNLINNNIKSKSGLSLAQRKQNLSQGNMDYINFDEYYNYNNFQNSRNQRIIMKKPIKDNNKDFYNNKTQKKKYSRYDNNKCIIERKIYADEKKIKKHNDTKNVENKTLPNNCDNMYNKMLFNNIKLNINKELNLNALRQSEKIVSNLTNITNMTNITNNSISNNININENNHNISNSQSNKLLIKSRTNNILNTSLEELTEKSNEIQNINNKTNKNNKNKEIKLIFPSFVKNDFNNDSSQESTNQIISTYSNKMTINNANIGYRKEKFISSFLDGPEDIHYRFVELHKQRKMFYENLCNKLEENKNCKDINNINKQNMNDFEKSEYSEYFDNYNEDVPFI